MKFRGPQPPGNVPGKPQGNASGKQPGKSPKAPPRRHVKAGRTSRHAATSAPHPAADKPTPPVKPPTKLRRPPVVPTIGQHKTENANDNILASKIRELIVKELQAGSKTPSPAKPKVRRTSAPPSQPASNQNRTRQQTDKNENTGQQEWRPQPSPSRAGAHIATYHRQLPVGLARLYETVLDWRNPPPLHGSSYAKVDCLKTWDSGWRIRATRTNPQNQTFELQLRIDRMARRWVCKVLTGPDAGTQIWTQAIPVGRRHTDIIVDFLVPGVTHSNFSEMVGIYTKLYTDLLDRDIDRMLVRQSVLDQPHPDSAAHKNTATTSGSRVDIIRGTRAFLFDPGHAHPAASGTTSKMNPELIAHVLQCDYMRNAASTWSVTDHIVQCPHHKMKFDLRTGGRVLNRLPGQQPTPRIHLDPHSRSVVSLMAEMKPALATNRQPALW